MNQSIHFFSHIGGRSHQEDAFHVSEDGRLLVVCDGVGGQSGGDIASSTITKNIAASYKSHQNQFEEYEILECIWEAQAALHHKVKSGLAEENCSTTIALAYISSSKIIMAHAGDSRVVFISKSENKVIASTDHSMVQEMRHADILKTDEEMLSHHLRNRITKCISGSLKSNVRADIEISRIDHFGKGDLLFLGTDGALESFTTIQLAEHFSIGEIEKKWHSYKASCIKNSKDNNTAILKTL